MARSFLIATAGALADANLPDPFELVLYEVGARQPQVREVRGRTYLFADEGSLLVVPDDVTVIDIAAGFPMPIIERLGYAEGPVYA